MKILSRVIVTALTLYCTSVWAVELPKGERPCKEEDLIGGTWKLVQFNEVPADKETTWVIAIPYHYLTFYQDHYYSFVAVDHEVQTPTEVKTALEWPQKSKHVLKYTLNNSGVLDLYIDKNLNYRYRCVAFTADTGTNKKSDLILTGYAKDRHSEFYKLYRRWF